MQVYCKECSRKYLYNWKHVNKEKVRASYRKYYQNNRLNLLEKYKHYRNTNKERRRKTVIDSYYKNKNKSSKREAERLQNDEIYRLKQKIRKILCKIRRIKSTNVNTCKIIGCSFEELYKYLNQTFIKHYNREPSKDDILHVHHLTPLFTAKTKDDLIRLNHYSNLCWLLDKDHIELHKNLLKISANGVEPMTSKEESEE